MGGLDDQEKAELLLNGAGFQKASDVLAHLRQLLDSYRIKKLSQRGREKLDILIPLLIVTAIEQQDQDAAIHHSLKFIESVARRDVYLALLIERPHVLKQMVRLCADSAWIAEQITRYPLLLDELLDPRRLYDPLEPEALAHALQAQLTQIDDLERQMDKLRQFKRANVLHVAAAEISGNLTVELVSDYLTAIADTLMRRALSIASDYLMQKHGQPFCVDDGKTRQAALCVVAYGKAGGIELSYSSDLDIVFLHDSRGDQQFTNGYKQLDNNVFFMRFAQRIIHLITTNTPAGILYEVDSRLRPGGNSAMLVSSFEAFEGYQWKNAWTWEHQALVRARAVAGSPESMAKFESIRRDILSQQRDPVELKSKVCEMRAKMRENLDKSTEVLFDLKQGRGGIADIEFIIQYGVLRWAVDYPRLLETTGMLPLLGMFAEYGLIEELACHQLSEAFRAYRGETHRLALQNKSALVEHEKFALQREEVKQWWAE
ncbi:bifunctional glutamine-synthetase adenylyltransferase/deadenyltransferase, partial [Candidatus Thiomargarita nelsonii]